MNEPSEDNRGSQDRVDIGDLVVSVIYSCCLFQTKPPTTPMPITNVSQLIQHVESAAAMLPKSLKFDTNLKSFKEGQDRFSKSGLCALFTQTVA